MAVERYNLGAIKRRIRNEFALEDSPETNDFLNEKINQAHVHIARQRGRWHWQLKEAAIDIPDGHTIEITATKGSRIITLDSGTPPEPRSILVKGSSDYGTQGYLVTAVSGNQITLSRQWLDTSGSSISVNVQTGYVELPDDFYALETTDEISDINGTCLRRMDTQRFRFIRNKSQLSIGTERIYTITGDPLHENLSGRYIAFYPYYGTIETLYYSYYYVPDQMVTDQDEPILPIGDRPVLVDFSLWFVAQAKGYDKVVLYRDTALDGLNSMMQRQDDDATVDLPPNGGLVLDMSGTREYDLDNTSDYNPVIT